MKDLKYFLDKLGFEFPLRGNGDDRAKLLASLFLSNRKHVLKHKDIPEYLTLIEELIQEVPQAYFDGPKDCLPESMIHKALAQCPDLADRSNIHYIRVIELVMNRTKPATYNQEKHPLFTALQLGLSTIIIEQLIQLSGVIFTQEEEGPKALSALISAEKIIKNEGFRKGAYIDSDISDFILQIHSRYKELKPKSKSNLGWFANRLSLSPPAKPISAAEAPKPSPRARPRVALLPPGFKPKESMPV